MILLDDYTGKGGVFALGNFDGVHRGHRLLLNAAVDRARSLGVAARVLTFEPHPRALFVPNAAPFRLTPLPVKERLIKACGIDDVVICPFTAEFARMTATDFVEHILHKTLGAHGVIAGQDFTFGYQRGGTMRDLAIWTQQRGIGIQEIALAGDDAVYSSTRIRDLLRQGAMDKAAALLGRPWSIAGVVIKGEQRGGSIGVPTANIALGDYLRPRFGVYAVAANRVGATRIYRGVANIGKRPTVGGGTENLEAHLFDFDADIYGQEWQFTLAQFIRPEQKFDSLAALKTQIARDIESVKKV